jgi:hypothetical protein
MELRHSSKFERSLSRSVIENVLKSCANKLAYLKLRATPQLKFFKSRPLDALLVLLPVDLLFQMSSNDLSSFEMSVLQGCQMFVFEPNPQFWYIFGSPLNGNFRYLL